MAVQMQSGFLLTTKFEKLKFNDFSSSVDSTTSSTPSTPSTPCSPSINEPYEIEIITKDDKDSIIDFLKRFFFRDEPLNYHTGLLDGKDTCLELEEYSVKDIGNGLNLKAVLNGRIIGVCLNGIVERGYLNDDDNNNVHCNDEKFAKILELLHYVGHQSDIFAHYPEIDKAMTVKILSVDGSMRGRGIAKALMNKTREMARESGCGLMAADCSSHFTAKALKRLGFECIYTLKYEDYKVNGEVVFKPELPHVAVTVYTQRI